jgi:hypothetical protein
MELFDDANQIFVHTKTCDLQLEHSLVSLSKWESKWQKPFLSSKDKTLEETLDYIRCMTINEHVCPVNYRLIPKAIMDKITAYIEAPMTATTFAKTDEKATNKEVVTAEIIYYWMIAFNIPFECQKWHLNRLLTLINVCSIKNQPKKKMGRKEALSKQRALNETRKAQLNTKG